MADTFICGKWLSSTSYANVLSISPKKPKSLLKDGLASVPTGWQKPIALAQAQSN